MLDDPAQWAGLNQALSALFLTEPRDHWITLTTGRDAGVTPVLELDEIAAHPQTQAREMVVEHDGLNQVGIAPKLSDTPGGIRRPPAQPGAHGEALLLELGLDPVSIRDLRQRGIID